MRTFKRVISVTGAIGIAAAGVLGITAAPAAASVPCPYTYCGTSASLTAGQTLQPGDWIASPNKVFSLVMQSDSNLVMHDANPETHWSTGTSAKPDNAWLAMQADGNLVMYRAGGTCGCGSDAYWASGTAGHSGDHVTIQNDGNVVIYGSDNSVLWATNVYTYSASMGATETAFSKPDNVTSIASRTSGSAIHIWCQTNVGADTGHGFDAAGNYTWDHLAEGGWVADWNTTTPQVGANGYSSGVPRCHRNGPLTLTSFTSSNLANFPGVAGQVWEIPNSHTVGPLFNDGGDYWQSVHAEATSSALAAGNCQDLVLANSNFWWLFDPSHNTLVLNNVDQWGPASAGGGTDAWTGKPYPARGRVVTTATPPQVGDIVVFGHGSFTPSGHVADVIRVDSDGYVVAEFNVHANGQGGNGRMDFRKIAYSNTTQNNPIAFIR
jgi:hypothetical protein